jgi:hypothetical protein
VMCCAIIHALRSQGLLAYYYDMVQPNTAVELNQCRFNHMGMDVRYRHHPNFIARKVKKIGKCRNNLEYCEDCMTTNVSLIYSVHYTQCKYCTYQYNMHVLYCCSNGPSKAMKDCSSERIMEECQPTISASCLL